MRRGGPGFWAAGIQIHCRIARDPANDPQRVIPQLLAGDRSMLPKTPAARVDHQRLVGGRCSSMSMARISSCLAAGSSNRSSNRACGSAVAALAVSTSTDATSAGSVPG